MSDKIRVFVYSDAPCVHTGFGRVAREILLRLHETGKYQLPMLGVNHYGDPHDLEGIFKIHRCSEYDMQGQRSLGNLLMGYKPDVFFTINDYDALDWVPKVLNDVKTALNKNIPWVWYFPVDGEPFSKTHAELMKRFVDYPVTYTKFAQKTMKKTDPSLDVPMVYHGVNTSMFKRLDDKRRGEIKKQVRVDGKFVVLGIGVNQLRKQYGLLLEAYRIFKKGKEGKVALYLHTQQNSRLGWNIPQLVDSLGLDRKEVFYTEGINGPMGVGHDQMNYVYNAADVAVFPHIGEGFGLCQVEAMAAEVPVISHGVTATPEVVGDAGILIPTEKITDPENPRKKKDLTYVFPFGDRSLQRPIPSLSKMVQALNDLYENEQKRKELGKKGREFILNNPQYNWDYTALQFDNILTEASQIKNSIDLTIDEII